MSIPFYSNPYCATPTYISASGLTSMYSNYCTPQYVPEKVETKKEKLDRVSLEKKTSVTEDVQR